ncbi:MAG: nucleotidyl transferase AbiEii/AbiGii toxin family protein [Deltaproteobacteria bacterium]|nr:nucleotidyl transferase AbiEii/AbiGii toxin family protein [Deltaproteobacteria bacterium]
MRDLITHEKLEIEVLEALNSRKLLEPLVFGGGTMLRLCHDLNRYSAGLDFWFVKETDTSAYHKRMKAFLNERYQVSDAHNKRYTLVYEFRTAGYPRHLKIEIRKEIRKCKWKEMIAFSKHTHRQVLLKAMTLEQMMQNKIEAFLDSEEIRDCFDMEFMLRKGVSLQTPKNQLEKLRSRILKFKARDFSVTLGSLLDRETREYYRKNRFEYLVGNINHLLSE